jgi:alpha-methylacyl-CoA racemase
MLLRTPAKAPTSNKESDVFLEVGGESKIILAEAGFSEEEIRSLVAKNAVTGAGLEKSSL